VLAAALVCGSVLLSACGTTAQPAASSGDDAGTTPTALSYTDEDLYRQTTPDLLEISDPLFDFAIQQLNKRDNFLPFGAALNDDGIALKAAWPGGEYTSSAEVLPLLHKGLRQTVTERTRAVAVCEWVKITPSGGSQTDAIKVLVEHRNGLTVALYLSMEKVEGQWQNGEPLSTFARPEIGAW